MGDEIQILGVPDEEALHPLARRAERYYRYAVVDSMRMVLPGRTVRVVAVAVEPTVYGPTLLSGTMWLDADSLDVVRLMAAVVGENIWHDDPDSPVMRSMEIDLEYGLHQNRYWLPSRQIVTATFDYKYLPGATLPTTTVTTFSDYELVVDARLGFTRLPPRVTGRRTGARWRCEPFLWDVNLGRRDPCGEESFVRTRIDPDGTRWEVRVPSLDSLDRFDFDSALDGSEQLAAEGLIRQRVGDLASLSQDLPDEFAADRRLLSVDWSQLFQVFQYNRVQGPTLGGGHVLDAGPAFTTLHTSARFSFSNRRVTGSLTWRRDGPAVRVDLEAFRALRYAEPWTVGVPIGNSLKALFSGHDDADYHLALGGGVRLVGYQGVLRDVDVTVRFERQRGMPVQSGSGINDFFFGSGLFQPNPPIAEGDFVRAGVIRSLYSGRAMFRLGVEGLFGKDVSTVRAWGSGTVPYWLGGGSGVFRVRAGTLTGDPVTQMQFRVGGPETVRGHTYGVRRGQHFWSVQWEQELGSSAWWAPVVFADAGDFVVSPYDFDPLVGLGVGLSALNGWIRLDLAKGVNPDTSLRFDLLFRIPR